MVQNAIEGFSDTLHLALPDWLHLDTVLNHSLPFALWSLGDQPLLYHWLDYAVNENFQSVKIYCSDRPAAIREAMQEAQLWPLKWEVVSMTCMNYKDLFDELSEKEEQRIYIADTLPLDENTLKKPQNGWELLDYWFALEKLWFDRNFLSISDCPFIDTKVDLKESQGNKGLQDMGFSPGSFNKRHIERSESVRVEEISIGRFCSIHASVILKQPIWIGDHVTIGPGCEIGPYASIGDGAYLQGPSIVKSSRIESDTFLAGCTELDHALLKGGLLLNLKYRGRVDQIDGFIATSLRSSENTIPWIDRIVALCLYLLSYGLRIILGKRRSVEKLICFDGDVLKVFSGEYLGVTRSNWFLKVFLGKMKLFGALPRTQSDLDKLKSFNLEWGNIIQSTKPGVFSYADLQGCHSVKSEDEALHAIYQITQAQSEMQQLLWKKLVKLFFIREKDVIAE